jgi:amino acid adenylation domain-containing protein/non-ribosomal peptide synthase protein (TIGR01720 family)
MGIAELPIQSLKQRARNGDREALQALRDGGFFRTQATVAGLPVSHAQQRLWVAVHQDRAGDAYVISLSLRLCGPLRHAELQQALATLSARHETLRTRFAEIQGELRQFVDAPGAVALPVADFRAAADPEMECRAYLQGRLLAPFDLRQGPLWRVDLCRLSAADHVLVLLIHHIIADAWSLEVLQREWALLYQAYCAGKPDPLPPLVQQYRDYVAWQRGRETTEAFTAARRYWRDQLSMPLPRLQLPTDFPRPRQRQSAGASLQLHWDEIHAAALRELATRHNTTLFIALQALVKVLLYRYSGQTDIVIGTPIAGRDHAALEDQVGLFINLLPLRDRVDPHLGFDRFLEQVSHTAYAAYAHRHYPFDALVEDLAVTRDTSHAPLFDVLVTLQNVAPAEVALADLRIGEFTLGAPFAKYDLTFEFAEYGGALVLVLTYSTALFEAATIERLGGHLDRLLEGVLAEPERAIGELPLLTGAERAQLAAWNATATAYPRQATVAALFAAQAAATPEAVALVSADRQLSYRELDARANRLAQYLTAHYRPAPDQLIGLCLERSPELIVGMLAILKAGAAYLPLDADYPPERLRFMLEDAGVTVLLTQASLQARLPASGAAVICVDRDWPVITGYPDQTPANAATADSLAYVMYTSGSTGQPKGVGVPQRGVVRLVKQTHYARFAADEVFLHYAPVSFDAATFEIWGALLNGARLVLMPPAQRSLADLGAVLQQQGITTLWLTSSLFNLLLDEQPAGLRGLRQLLVGGEALSVPHIRQALAQFPDCQLINGYGPTENTTFTCCYPITPQDYPVSIPIGAPIANTTVYVLDEQQQVVPIGVPGELYIGGDGLARGYLHRPELTAERFVDVASLGRLYRTGDRCRWRADGALEFLGRLDDQIKLRGFRIEPGEIETLLRRESEIKDAAVVVQGEAEHRHLVAYLVPALPSLELNAIRQNLRRQLPEYLVPSQFMVLTELPLTPNGKLDRRRLPALPSADVTGSPSDCLTPTEELLASLWCNVLKRAAVGRDDHFFELGGHSLLATQLVSRIRDSFTVDLPLYVVFEHPVLRDQAAALDHSQRGHDLPPIQARGGDTAPVLSFAQQRLWFLAELEGGAAATYLISAALRLDGALDVAALRSTLRELTTRHTSLRMNFGNVGGQPVIHLRAPYDPLTVEDLSTLPAAEQDAAVRRQADAHAGRPFDLSHDPLLRLTLLHLGVDTHVLLFTLHHLIADGWSLGVLVRDLNALYGAACAGQTADLPPLPIDYADYAAWQRGWLQGTVREQQLAYWREQLAGAPSLLNLPTDYPRPAVKTYRGAHYPLHLDADLVAQLQALSRSQGATLFMTLLAAFQVLLYRYSGETDLLVGSPIANRTHSQTESLIGLFVNTLVLRTRLTPDQPFTALLAEVRRTALAAYAHQDLPFEALVDALQPERSLGHSPLFQVLFALQNAPAETLTLGDLALRPLAQEQSTAKFDLSLSLEETANGGLAGVWEYSTDLFAAVTIARWSEHFTRLLRGIVADPQQPLSQLPLLPDRERQQLAAWNATATAYPRQATVAALFAAQATATPEAIALVSADRQLSYRELDARANRLAQYLTAHYRPAPDQLVGLCLERSPELIVGMLAILKAGAAYLPLDPDYPAERIRFVLEDADVAVLLTQAPLQTRLPESGAAVVCVDRDWPAIATHPDQAPVSTATADSLAYVMYTSGSTGQPKGVGVPQYAINRLVCNTNYIHLGPGDRIAQASNIAFDAATFEVWGALLNGATVQLFSRDDLLDPDRFAAQLRQRRCNVLFLTTALFNRCAYTAPSLFHSLDYLLFGGEAVDPRAVAAVLAHGRPRQLLHVYGPTESTTFASWQAVETLAPDAATVPIGRPLANTQLYVLDAYHQPVPVGIPGELYIGGDGLARGYLHRPELTAERFVDVAGLGRLYRTGDRCRWRTDGALEFLGRLDGQIKLRGFRIEPGEIETLLRREPEIKDAAVMVQGEAEHRQLVAYLVPAVPSLELNAIRQNLRRQLPEYLVPSQFMVLAELPLTPNGKLDRQALPKPSSDATTALFEAPCTAQEQRLAAIWAKVLGRERIGRQDNFFALGGDSILSIQIIAKAREAGLLFSVRDLFQYQTVAELSPQVRETAVAIPETVEPGIPVPLTPIQQWFFRQERAEPWYFNQSVLLRLREPMAVDVLQECLRTLLDQHAAFRLRYRQTAAGWIQTYANADGALPLHIEDLRELPVAEQASALQERATAWQRSLNLSEGPLSRLVLFELSDGPRLLWCAHHLVVDGVSWRIVLADLQMLLEAARRGAELQPPPPSAAFGAWACYLDAYAHSPDLEEDTRYWRNLPTPATLPLDFADGAPTLDSTAHYSFRLDPADTRALLEEVHRAYNTRSNDLLLTALAQTLAQWTGRRDVIVDLEGHGRSERPGAPDVSRTVGWFTAVYPVHLALPATDEPAACLQAVKEQLRAVPGEGLGYGVWRYLAAGGLQPWPEAAIAFNYLGQFDQLVRDSLLDFAAESSGESHSRQGQRPRPLDVDALVYQGELQVTWSYSANQFRATTIQQLAESYRAALRALIAHCRAPASAGYTPSDFPLASLTQAQLDALAARYGRHIAAIYPLSPMQQGMLFHSLYATSNSAPYLEQLHCRIEGPLDAARFRAAWTALLQRHPVLRTAFQPVTHPTLQIVYRDAVLPWHEADWRGADEQQCLDELLAAERQRGFDWVTPPLFQCHLLRLGEHAFRFVWCFHHILLDGWSLPILFRELFSLYAMPAAVPPPRPYEDYIVWLTRQDPHAAAAHWRDYLAGFQAPTPLPGARPVIVADTAERPAEAVFALDAAATRQVLEFASQQHLTISTLLLAAWGLLLSRYSGETDVVFGVTVSGRDIDLPGIEDMIGLFINTVPLRLRIDDSSLPAWLQAVQVGHQDNMPYAYTPLAEIQHESAVPNGVALFDSIVVFENYPMESSLPTDGHGDLRFTDLRAIDHTSYPLTVVASAGQTLQFRIGYDARRFEYAAIERLSGHLRNLLLGLATTGPHSRPCEVPLLDAAERQQLLDWSRARQGPKAPQTLLELFAAQVARSSHRVAVVCDGRHLTYGELNARANRLAHRLRRQGVQPDDVVGLCATRSLELVVGLLGILKAGAGYLPLDPGLPPARLALMLEDAGAVGLVLQAALAEWFPAAATPRVYLESLDVPAADTPDEDPLVPLQPQHLAYVIYTSGSTGRPKGVMITHANVTRLFAATQPDCQFSDADVWTLFHSFAFDFSVWELWGALLFGGRLVVVPYSVSRDPAAFYTLLESEGVTILNQTPSAFRQLIPVAEQKRRSLALRLVMFGGEALDLPALEPWFALYGDRQPQLVNLYGITETTVHVTWCPLRRMDSGCTASLIGRPLADLDLYLLDAEGRPVPVGIAGEIYVGGAGLARGYLNRPELTAERFIEAVVFGRRQRLYRSGDLARWRPDGSLEYLGRSDHQVKLRGFRIELGEIEASLCQHPQVREAVVVPCGAAPRQTLAAYVVARRAPLTAAGLRDWLVARLPDYMVPAHFVSLDRLPLTSNGKVDRQALPEPGDAHLVSTTAYVAPRTGVEHQLVAIWQEVLGVDTIGIEHNFFELGGHSLTAMQIVSRIHQALGVKLPLRNLFEHPTIAALAALIGVSAAADPAAIVPAPPAVDYPLSHAQQRLWLDHQAAGTSNYNMPEAFLFEQGFDIDALKRTLATVVERHEILRTAFVVIHGEPRQRILERLDFPVREVDLSTAGRCEGHTQESIDQEANAPFELDKPPLFRVTLIRQSASRCVLVMVMHHIISDGWSRNVLHRELSALYNAYCQGQPNPLAPLRIQYKDYAVWESARGFEPEERYWLDKLSGAPTRIDLPRDSRLLTAEQFCGDRQVLVLDPAVTGGLRDLAARRNTSLSTVVLALFKLLLFRLSGQDDFCVSMVVANRCCPELEHLLGCFVNVLPIRTRLSAEMEFTQLLDQVAVSTYEALEHQNYPFNVLVHRIGRADGAVVRPFFDVLYAYQSASTVHIDIGTELSRQIPGLTQSLDFSFKFTKTELCLNVADFGHQGLGFTLEYNSNLFRSATIEKYLTTLERFARAIAV